MFRRVVSSAASAGKDETGVVAVILAVAFIPLVLSVGVAIDMARLVQANSMLQSALDGAALAGASAYQSESYSSTAQSVALSYFKAAPKATDMVIASGNPTASAAPGYYSTGVSGYNVTVSAVATLKTTFLNIAGIATLNLSGTAVASNPQVQPVVTLGPIGSSAADWNSAYMYAVPNGSNGNPDFSKMPPFNQFYEVGSNCNSSSSNWTSNSMCNNGYGSDATKNQANFPIVAATTPLAFMFVNMNNGMSPSGQSGYGPNQYNAQPGYYEIQQSSYMSQGLAPSYNTDNTRAVVKGLLGYDALSNQTATTRYGSLNSTSKPNCAIQIVSVDPNNLPTSPPYPGQCLSNTDTRSGYQLANLSCAQIAGRTIMYWWNDMGAPTDDYDYKNLYFTIRCLPGTAGPNGGTLSNGSNSNYANLGVSLIQ